MDDASPLSESVLQVDAPKAPVEEKRSDQSFLRIWEDLDGFGENLQAGPSRRNVETEIVLDGPPSSSKATPLRLLNEGLDGVKSPSKLTAAKLPDKVRLHIQVEPDMVLQQVGVVVLASALDGSASAEGSSVAVKSLAFATDKNKWEEIFRAKQHSQLSEKYKEFRVDDRTRMIRPPFSDSEGRAILHFMCMLVFSLFVNLNFSGMNYWIWCWGEAVWNWTPACY